MIEVLNSKDILHKEEERIQLLGAAIWNCVPSFLKKKKYLLALLSIRVEGKRCIKSVCVLCWNHSIRTMDGVP